MGECVSGQKQGSTRQLKTPLLLQGVFLMKGNFRTYVYF